MEVRVELEALVTRANSNVANPIERIAGGMRVAAAFAVSQPKRSTVLLRGEGVSTALAHPLNEGLRRDIDAACAQGLLRPKAKDLGVLYWLGLCQVLMASLVENPEPHGGNAGRVRDMLTLGLAGLGVSDAQIEEIVGSDAFE